MAAKVNTLSTIREQEIKQGKHRQYSSSSSSSSFFDLKLETIVWQAVLDQVKQLFPNTQRCFNTSCVLHNNQVTETNLSSYTVHNFTIRIEESIETVDLYAHVHQVVQTLYTKLHLQYVDSNQLIMLEPDYDYSAYIPNSKDNLVTFHFNLYVPSMHSYQPTDREQCTIL